ncbi:hypothetical protein [Nannocystis pusilla]|uniref:hypothetical protein n=1 Tax=Nannocystis pusilla TaxID=889268 RepID=UPI003BF39A9F
MTATKKRTAAAKPARTAKAGKAKSKTSAAAPPTTTKKTKPAPAKTAAKKQAKAPSKKPAPAKTAAKKQAKAPSKKPAPAKAAAKKQAKAPSKKPAPAKAPAKKQATPKAKPAPAEARAKKQAKAPSKKPAPAEAPAKKQATPRTVPAKQTTTKKSAPAKPAAKQATSKKPADLAAPAKKPATIARKTTPPAEWLVGPLAPLRELAEAVADLGVRAVDDDASKEAGQALRERYADNWTLGVLWSPALWDACQARAQPLRLWATGPAQRGARDREFTPSFYLDPAEPGRLWYTPDPALPAALFVPLPATRAAIEQALTEFGPHTPSLDLAEAKTVRAFMGEAGFLRVPSPYTGELEPAGPHELDRHFNFSPVVTPHAWGSAFVDDPLHDAGTLSALQEVVALREIREQLADSLPRFTRRAWFSRAFVAIEMHSEGRYVWEVTYRPSRFASEVIAELNKIVDAPFPADLPLDVAAALHGFLFLDAAWFEATIAGETDLRQRGALVSAALAVVSDDIVEAARIARAALARDEADQVAVANAALQYNWQFLLEELGSRTASAELRAQITAVLAQGIPPPQVDEHGEPADLYDSIRDTEEQDDA